MGKGNAAALTGRDSFFPQGQSCLEDLSLGVRLGCMLIEILVTQLARDSSQ